MELTKTNLTNLKDNNDTLADDVINYVLDCWSDYDNKEAIFTDVLYYGCQAGTVGHLVYYADTLAYYEQHKSEINEMLYELMKETGLDPAGMFGDKWDADDPLALETNNQNLLAWFGFEETMRKVAMNFETLESKI